MAKNKDSGEFLLKRTEILNKANEVVTGDRQQDYGPPDANFRRVAEFWSTYLEDILKVDLNARQIADMLVLLKVARLVHSPTDDSYIDIAGYASLASELGESDIKPDTTTGANIYINSSKDINDVVQTINSISTSAWRGTK